MAQQNLDFNIIAHTKGMEAIATMINRVGALEAETKRLASANATLSASTDTVIRNGVRYNNAMDAQSRALRQNRQGTQQLGMQINDFATSVSSGSSVTQAFTQQLGQVGYAMSQMGGIAGKLGGFLAGPWGALVLVGAVALSPLIEKLWDTAFGASAAEKALDDLIKKRREEKAEQNKISMGEKGLNELLRERDRIVKNRGRGKGLLFGGSLFGGGPIEKQLSDIDAKIAEARDAIDAARTTKLGLGMDSITRDLYKPVKPEKERTAGGGKTDAMRAAEKAAKEQEKIAQWIAEKNIAADQEWRKYWSEAEMDQMAGLQEKLQFMGEMADATVQTTTERLIKPVMDQAQEIQNAFANVGFAVNDAFKGMITGAMSWKDGLRGIIQSVIDELWRLYVVQQIVGFVTKAIGGVTGNPGPSMDSAITVTRGRAVGGYVAAQTPYVVGEKGPELFVPGGSGTIIPNKNMGGAGGGTNGMVINVDARGSNDPAAVRAQVQQGIIEAAPAIIAAAQAKTVSGLRRPRLGGVMQ